MADTVDPVKRAALEFAVRLGPCPADQLVLTAAAIERYLRCGALTTDDLKSPGVSSSILGQIGRNEFNKLYGDAS